MTLEEELSALTWLAPWIKLDFDETQVYERALARSLVPEHALHGRAAKAVAVRFDDDLRDHDDDEDTDAAAASAGAASRGADEALFLMDGPEPRLYVVNLASAGGRTAESPFYSAFESAREFEHACMLPDHLEYSDEDV